jgi:hypothetical protein
LLSASYSGGTVSYSFSGFQPDAPVTLYVLETGGSLIIMSNSEGSGSGSFADTDAPGTYTLAARDDFAHVVNTTFTIPVTVPPVLQAVYSGGIVEYLYSGFSPNATITLYVLETGGSVTTHANFEGSGDGSFQDTDPPGVYTLAATDLVHVANTVFNIS